MQSPTEMVPPTVGQLAYLHTLFVDDDPDLLTPPPEIVACGTPAMLSFLRELQEDSTVRYEAKLFIVGLNLHWREGVMLAYQNHTARVELNPMLRELRLLVQGPLPQNFFTILMSTVDVVLSRFEGLAVRRENPCICHW